MKQDHKFFLRKLFSEKLDKVMQNMINYVIPHDKYIYDCVMATKMEPRLVEYKECVLCRSPGGVTTVSPDLVTVLQPGMDYQAKTGRLIIAFEVKASEIDLSTDHKMLNYLHWANYLILAVPTHLCQLAAFKIQDTPIGLINIDTGEILKKPEYNYPSYAHVVYVLGEMCFSEGVRIEHFRVKRE